MSEKIQRPTKKHHHPVSRRSWEYMTGPLVRPAFYRQWRIHSRRMRVLKRHCCFHFFMWIIIVIIVVFVVVMTPRVRGIYCVTTMIVIIIIETLTSPPRKQLLNYRVQLHVSVVLEKKISSSIYNYTIHRRRWNRGHVVWIHRIRYSHVPILVRFTHTYRTGTYYCG